MYNYKSNKTADFTEQLVKLDLINRGWVVLEPSSRDTSYDLLVETGFRKFETVQVKSVRGNIFHTTNRGSAQGKEFVSENGKVRNCYSYADELIDWMVAVDVNNHRIYYYPLDIYRSYDKINIQKVEPVNFGTNKNLVSKRPPPILRPKESNILLF